ncbi:MAG: hypothetical protein Q8N97_05155 [Methanobacteriaceae archaeon]|nr:hypothetical protein [Methanobacteriaceae archaeon]
MTITALFGLDKTRYFPVINCALLYALSNCKVHLFFPSYLFIEFSLLVLLSMAYTVYLSIATADVVKALDHFHAVLPFFKAILYDIPLSSV